jgi:hypothetical protein
MAEINFRTSPMDEEVTKLKKKPNHIMLKEYDDNND